MSFATGFFNTAADRVTERKKYIRDKNAKDRDYLMTYGTQAVRKTEEEANKAITIGKLLEGRGLERDKINFVVEQSGPQGLAILYNTIKDFKPSELSTKQLNEYVTMAEDYRPSGTTYDDMIKKSFGLYKNGVTDNPEKNEERGIWSFLGLDANAADSSMADSYLGGYTGYDLKRIMSSSAPSLKAPLPVDRSLLPKVYDPTQNRQMFTYMEDQILNIARKASTVGTEEYIKLPEEQKKLISTIQASVKAEDTKELLRLLPDATQAVMDYERMFPGALTNNSFWTTKYMDFIFGDDAEPIVTGEDASLKPKLRPDNLMEGLTLEDQYSALTSGDEDATPFSLLPEFENAEEAQKSKDLKVGDYVIIGGQLTTAGLPADKISSVAIVAMSDSELSKALMPIMKKWDEENPEPSGRARVGHSRKREKYYIEQRKLVQEGQAQAADVSDATGSIVDPAQEEFDKAIQKLVAERLVKIPDGDPNDIATMIAYRVRRTDPRYKDLKPSKIQKD
tara:strand:+ start:1247 stop:2770 length:1524 start_codon:yes stop_codon:yes gene_type:complete